MQAKFFKSYFFTLLMGALFAFIGGVNPAIGAGIFLVARMGLQHVALPTGALFNAVDVSAITAYADEHKRDLIATLINGLDIAQDITVVPNVKNKVKLPKLSVGNGLRPYSSTTEFKPGQLKFTDRELVTETGKRELLIDWRDFKNTYLAWRTSPGAKASKTFNDMTFSRFVWEQVIKNLQREINDETAYFGFDKGDAVAYSGAATYDPGDIITYTQNGVLEYFINLATTTAGQSPDSNPEKWLYATARAVAPGLKTYVDQLIASTELNEVAIGAITDGSTALAGFKELYRSHTPAYKRSGIVINASYTDCEFLLDGLEDKITKYTMTDVSGMVKMGLIPIPGTNGKGYAKPATWLGESRRMIAQPIMPNTTMGLGLVLGTDLLSDLNDIKTKENLWTIEAGIAAQIGFQIPDPEAVRINDQE